MDLKLQKETIAVKETVLDSCFEQAVETDYILPDYYPDIFRVIKCRIMPRIVSQSIIGSDLSTETKKLSYDTEATIRVWYLSQNSKVINCIEQKLSFSNAIDVTIWSDHPEICLNARCDYVNCRVVNQRRLDIRGAFSVKAKICDEKLQNIICGAEGGNIQLKKNLITLPAGRLVASKKITVIEELELGIAKPPILSVIKSDCDIISKEFKAIANKLVAKGEAVIDMLYTCSKEDEHGIESMKFTIPFSQIIDVEGIDDNYDISIDITPSSCDIITKGSGESTSFECELVLLVNCTASKNITGDIIVDAYSTCYSCEIDTDDIKLENKAKDISFNLTSRNILTLSDNEISEVIDCGCDISNVSSHLSCDDNSFIVNGNVSFCALVETKDGFPVMIEGDGIFEQEISCEKEASCCIIEPKVKLSGCNYTVTGESTVEVIADIVIEGAVYEHTTKKIITDIRVNPDVKIPVKQSCALKLYYADAEEDIWEIAKRNRTSVEAILEENDLSTTASDKLTEKTMILIPIIA